MGRVSKTRALYIVYLVILTFSTFVLGRTIIRTDATRQISMDLPDYDGIHRWDATREGGHLLPDLNGWMKGETLDRPVRIITNSKGFRNDREFVYTAPPRTLRILFLGDSFVDGMRTDQKDTIGYQWERLLNSRGCSEQTDVYEVLISGHNNPADAWYYYQEYGRLYHPQLVVLGVTLGNDLTWHGYRSTFRPIFGPSGQRMLLWQQDAHQTPPPQEWFPDDAYVSPNQTVIPDKIEGRLRTLLHDMFPQWSGYMIPAVTLPANNDRRHVEMQDFSTSLGLFYQPLLPQIERQYTNFFEILDGLADAVARHGGRLLVVLFPTRLQASSEEWKLFLKFFSLHSSKFDLSYPDRTILSFCKARSLPCLDLLPAFQAHYASSSESLYRPHGDMHFNEAGQRLAADQLFTFAKRILTTASRTFHSCSRNEAS
jgi:hypothetical protein